MHIWPLKKYLQQLIVLKIFAYLAYQQSPMSNSSQNLFALFEDQGVVGQ